MRLELICCAVLRCEINALMSEEFPHQIRVTYLTQGLHDAGSAAMNASLQEAIDHAETRGCDAVLLGYGLCNYGTARLKTKSVRLVLPRAHDCITLLLGSRSRYDAYFARHPGTYFQSTGWRQPKTSLLRTTSLAARHGLTATAEDLKRKYGAEAGEYLASVLCAQRKHYTRMAFIRMGVEADCRCEQECQKEASASRWEFDRVEGRLDLLRKLLSAEWESDTFLVVPPAHEICATYAPSIVEARPLRRSAS